MEEVNKTAAKPKLKHLVLDADAQEMFRQAFQQAGELTERQAIKRILEGFLAKTDLTEAHNPVDIAEIERLKSLICDRENCAVNQELTAKIEELTRINHEQQQELNEVARKLSAYDLDEEKRLRELSEAREEAKSGKERLPSMFGRLDWLLLKWCSARLSKEKGREYTPEETLHLLFSGYIAGKFHVFTKPNDKVIKVFKQKISQEDGTVAENQREA